MAKLIPGTFSAAAFRSGAGAGVNVIKVGTARVVNNFQTGRSLEYPVTVKAGGHYRLELLVSSMFSDSSFHVEVDGRDVTGRVAVPNTGAWNKFQWVGAVASLIPGKQVLTVVSDKQFFDLQKIRTRKVSAPKPAPAPTPTPAPPPTFSGERKFFCTFDNGVSPFNVQAKAASRVTLVNFGRDGGTAVKLTTEPGDSNVYGSGSMERCDLSLSQQLTDGYEGREAWWAHSVWFPDEYNAPANGICAGMDFHHAGPSGQANFHLDVDRWDGKMRFRGYGGRQDQGLYEMVIGPVVKNVWFDFVYHVRWSSSTDGFMRAWVNGKKLLDHKGPTLYQGIGCYLKLANYHTAFGKPSSIIHDRVIRGTTWQAVALGALEGV